MAIARTPDEGDMMVVTSHARVCNDALSLSVFFLAKWGNSAP